MDYSNEYCRLDEMQLDLVWIDGFCIADCNYARCDGCE